MVSHGGFIAYYRVSTGKQGRSGLGIEAQRQAVERLRAIEESRDQWRREAQHLRALIAQVPSWALFWRRCLNGLKAVLKPTDQWHRA